MKKITFFLLSFLISTFCLAEPTTHYWKAEKPDDLHSTHVYAEDESQQIKDSLFVGYIHDGKRCRRKIASGSIIFPGYKNGFTLFFTKNSVKFNPQNPYTCVEEHIQIKGKPSTSEVIIYHLENDGNVFTRAEPSEHTIRF